MISTEIDKLEQLLIKTPMDISQEEYLAIIERVESFRGALEMVKARM